MPYIGSTPNASFSSRTKQDFTANGILTEFTLSSAVASANDIEVFVGNVRQEPTDAYTVSGTILTMSAAPANGINFYVIFKGVEENSVVPADGTISSAKLVDNSVTSSKLPANSVTSAKIAANAITYAKINESSMRDKYFVETWAMTANHSDDTQMLGYDTANFWALNTDYAGTDHGSYANTQRMLTPGHHGGGDTMHSGGGVTGKQFFQFPENGIYSIRTNLVIYSDGADGACYIRIYKNQSGVPNSGGEMARFYSSAPANLYYTSMHGEVLIKIDDYINDFVSFSVYSISASDSVRGAPVTGKSYQSHIIFSRLGDVPS